MVHSELYSTVLSTFQTEGWEYTEVSGREVLRSGFEAHHTRVELHVQTFEPLSAHQTSNPAKRERLAELAMRVNQTLTIGNFELNWDAGQLIFRATNLFPTPQGDQSIIKGLVHNAIGEMDRIAPLENMVLTAEGATLAGINLVQQLQRIDLLPEVSTPDSTDH